MSQIKYYSFIYVHIYTFMYCGCLGLTSEKDSPGSRRGYGYYKCTGARRDSVVSARNKGDKSGDRTTSVLKTTPLAHLVVDVAFLPTYSQHRRNEMLCVLVKCVAASKHGDIFIYYYHQFLRTCTLYMYYYCSGGIAFK